jgi:hypothetical protein
MPQITSEEVLTDPAKAEATPKGTVTGSAVMAVGLVDALPSVSEKASKITMPC